MIYMVLYTSFVPTDLSTFTQLCKIYCCHLANENHTMTPPAKVFNKL